MATLNADNLYIKFGTERAHSLVDAGEPKTLLDDGASVLTFEINLTELTEAEQIINDVVALPQNAQVLWVKTIAEDAGATGVAVDMGLIHADRSTTTNVGPQVLLAASPIANYNADGETCTFCATHTVPASLTGTGAAIGTILPTSSPKYYITASRTTSTAFTAGRLRVLIGYYPSALADNKN